MSAGCPESEPAHQTQQTGLPRVAGACLTCAVVVFHALWFAGALYTLLFTLQTFCQWQIPEVVGGVLMGVFVGGMALFAICLGVLTIVAGFGTVHLSMSPTDDSWHGTTTAIDEKCCNWEDIPGETARKDSVAESADGAFPTVTCDREAVPFDVGARYRSWGACDGAERLPETPLDDCQGSSRDAVQCCAPTDQWQRSPSSSPVFWLTFFATMLGFLGVSLLLLCLGIHPFMLVALVIAGGGCLAIPVSLILPRSGALSAWIVAAFGLGASTMFWVLFLGAVFSAKQNGLADAASLFLLCILPLGFNVLASAMVAAALSDAA